MTARTVHAVGFWHPDIDAIRWLSGVDRCGELKTRARTLRGAARAMARAAAREGFGTWRLFAPARVGVGVESIEGGAS